MNDLLDLEDALLGPEPQAAPEAPPKPEGVTLPKDWKKPHNWKFWRKSDCVTDNGGNLVLREDGTPKRKFGKPGKPKPGDELAGGGVFGLQPDNTDSSEAAKETVTENNEPGYTSGFVNLPKDEPGSNKKQNGDEPTPGPKIGKIATKSMFTAFEKRGGEKWRPDKDEADLIGEAASNTMKNWRLPWGGVLIFGLSMYFFTRIVGERKAKVIKHVEVKNSNHGGEREREKPARKADDQNGQGQGPTETGFAF
ncbi:hypothetical protein [Poriferisphaera sp. WC338]|uniref:hypothetical protein n=1 Tax=Poriferisphaera sp. WC338 TaxID=3425129 RepID=UPI003D8140BC